MRLELDWDNVLLFVLLAFLWHGSRYADWWFPLGYVLAWGLKCNQEDPTLLPDFAQGVLWKIRGWASQIKIWFERQS